MVGEGLGELEGGLTGSGRSDVALARGLLSPFGARCSVLPFSSISIFTLLFYPETFNALTCNLFVHLSEWPTVPQLYVRSEFVGGCDIVLSSAYSSLSLPSVTSHLPFMMFLFRFMTSLFRSMTSLPLRHLTRTSICFRHIFLILLRFTPIFVILFLSPPHGTPD